MENLAIFFDILQRKIQYHPQLNYTVGQIDSRSDLGAPDVDSIFRKITSTIFN